MGLRFSDALRLSWTNVVQNKKQSLTIVLTIAALFGVVMGFSSLVAGVENAVISASAGQMDGEVYVLAEYVAEKNESFFAGKTIRWPEEVEAVTADLVPFVDEAGDGKVRERAKEYGGEVVGYYWHYSIGYPYRVADESVVRDFIDAEAYAAMPEDKIPVLMREGWEPPRGVEGLKERLSGEIYAVGSIPETEAGSPTIDGASPLNIILSQLFGSNNDWFYIIDDGSGKVLPFVESQLRNLLATGQAFYDVMPIQKTAVVKFSDPHAAVDFARPRQEILDIKVYNQRVDYFTMSDLFGTTLQAAQVFNNWRAMFVGIEILLLIVAVFIAAVTFAHLIDGDAATVALYRAMGASTREIYLIYLLYLFELCLFAVVAAVCLALIFIAMIAVTGGAELATRLTSFYHLRSELSLRFLRANQTFWSVPVVILFVAPLSLLFTLRNFSAKHIARKLKED